MTETRVNVEHYNTGEIETIDYIADKLSREEFRAYILGNILKYASRAQHKGQFASDVEKIRNYAVILQEHEEKYEPEAPEPRVWQRLIDIPHDVITTDNEGDFIRFDPQKGWTFKNPKRGYVVPITISHSVWDSAYSPYTEVTV